MAKLQRDRVTLAFDDEGEGNPPLVFLHPWSGERSFFELQVARFQSTHRCIAVDLRGHGASDVPDDGYTMGALADDVAWLCDELSLARAVVVGHSMGGIVGVHLASRHPDLLRAVVMLDSPLLPPSAFAELVPPLLEGMRSPAFRDVTRHFQGQFAGFGHNEDRRDALLDQLVAGPQHVKVATLESAFADADNEAAVRGCAVPVLYVGSGMGFSDLDRLGATLAGPLETMTVTGAGHFIQLEAPDQVNAALEGFLSSLDA